MHKISCIIIEDEPLAVKVLSDYLRDHTTELIFLDIHLPKLKGTAFLKALVNPPAIIITSSYHQYAVEGFNLNVTDYLLKPFGFDRFLAAVTKVKTFQSAKQKPDSAADVKDSLFLNVQKKKVRILYADIIYIESQREYIKIVTTKNEYISKMATHEIEDLLPPKIFKRVHRSYIISLNKIESYTADTVDVKGISIPLGRAYRDVLENL